MRLGFGIGALARAGAVVGMVAASAAGAQTAPETEDQMIERNTAVLQGLDRVTARVSTFDAPLGETVSFGSLRVTARACLEAPPIEPPESAAFLEVQEAKSGEATVPLFSGWMFASSPALSALEHPVYDVWVLSCADS